MKPLLTALAVIPIGLAVIVFINAQSAVHEIEALILGIISSIFIAARAVVGAIETTKINRIETVTAPAEESHTAKA